MGSPELLLLLVALANTFNTGLQYYTTVSTYPLFSPLPAEAFVGYHQAYERRLPLAIYLPYTLLMGATALLLLFRPEGVGLTSIVLLLLLNGAIMAISLAFAAPLHARLDREGKQEALLALLRRYNLPRLLLSTASTLLAGYLLVSTFGA